MFTNILSKLKQPQVLALIVVVVVQLGARYGFNFDSAAVQGNVLTALDWLTWASAAWVAHKSQHNSII